MSPAADLAFTPNGRKPGLLVAREPRWAEVTLHFEEPRSDDVIAPSVEIEKTAKAITAQPLLVVSSRVGAEQDAIGLQGGMQIE